MTRLIFPMFTLPLSLLVGCEPDCDDDGGEGGMNAPMSTGAQNVAACEEWLASMSCGDTDYSTLVSCDAYEEITCDVSDYFDCLTENTTCDEDLGVADLTGWTVCTDYAVCE